MILNSDVPPTWRRPLNGKYKVLVIDDEPAVRFGVRDFLEAQGYDVEEAADREAAKKAFRDRRPDAVILDYLLSDGPGLELMTAMKTLDAGVPILILTAHGSIDLAVRAIKEGADQFITKPVDLPSLQVLLQREIDHRRARRNDLAERWREARAGVLDPFTGTSRAIRDLEEQARKVLAFNSSILISGETGSGKGVLARWMHHNGPRADEPFVDLNCAGLTRELLESELFGYEKGAFTGAVVAKPGLLEIGDRGTVFLDEIGDLDLQIQPKLLTVLDEKRFRRLGQVRDRRVDIRLIAATNQDVSRLVREKKFRGDLYFRINTIPLAIPPLRERREDIPALARRVMEKLLTDLARPRATLSPEAETALQNYSWPGNLREMRNVLERALLLSSSDVLGPRDLRFEPSSADDGAPGGREDSNLKLDEVERRHIERVLTEENGHVERAATRLGLARSSLYHKIKRYGLAPSKS